MTGHFSVSLFAHNAWLPDKLNRNEADTTCNDIRCTFEKHSKLGSVRENRIKPLLNQIRNQLPNDWIEQCYCTVSCNLKQRSKVYN